MKNNMVDVIYITSNKNNNNNNNVDMNLGSYSNPSQNSNYHSRSRRQQLQHRPRQQLQRNRQQSHQHHHHNHQHHHQQHHHHHQHRRDLNHNYQHRRDLNHNYNLNQNVNITQPIVNIVAGSDKALLLSVECWENIFRYLTPNYNDLHSCLLVNRFFCKIVVPILWESPFSQYIKDKNKNNTQSKDLSNKCYHKLIRTILSGLSPIKKNYLIYNGINSIRHLPASTTFNYVSLIKSVILDQWTLDVSPFINYNNNNNDNNNNNNNHNLNHDLNYNYNLQFKKLILQQQLINLLVFDNLKYLKSLVTTECEYLSLFINHLLLFNGNNNQVEAGEFKELINDSDSDSDNKSIKVTSKLFSNLKEFHYNPTDFGYYVFTALSEASANNLTKLSIKDIFNVKQLESLKNLISSQNNLKYLKLELTEKLSQIESGGILSDYYCQLFSVLKSQKKSLTCLKLVNLNFRSITSDSINSLSECDNIRTLHLINCKNISSSRFFSLVFHNLKELKYENFYNFLNDQDFLINLLVHSNKSLEMLDVFYLRDDDIKKNDSNFIKILTSNCKNLKTLRLRLLQNDELFMIFKCLKNLTHFNFFLSDQSDWSEKTFRASSDLIPSTLKLLKIGIWQDLPSFDEFSLKEFLNGCKKINLDRLEIYSFPKLNVHYVSILEDGGVNYKLIEAMDDW